MANGYETTGTGKVSLVDQPDNIAANIPMMLGNATCTAHPDSHTRSIARRLNKPRSTVRRQVQALHLLQVLVTTRVEEKEGGADRISNRRGGMESAPKRQRFGEWIVGRGRDLGSSIGMHAGAGARLNREELDRRAAAAVSAYARAHDELSRLPVDGSIPGGA